MLTKVYLIRHFKVESVELLTQTESLLEMRSLLCLSPSFLIHSHIFSFPVSLCLSFKGVNYQHEMCKQSCRPFHISSPSPHPLAPSDSVSVASLELVTNSNQQSIPMWHTGFSPNSIICSEKYYSYSKPGFGYSTWTASKYIKKYSVWTWVQLIMSSSPNNNWKFLVL